MCFDKRKNMPKIQSGCYTFRCFILLVLFVIPAEACIPAQRRPARATACHTIILHWIILTSVIIYYQNYLV